MAGRTRQKSSAKKGKGGKLEQWVEVTVEDGKTVTRLFPGNDVLKREGERAPSTPECVLRRIFFPQGVPHEYHWAVEDEAKRRDGGAGVQSMTMETWTEAIEREKERGDGHVGPVRSLPRMTADGECECATCQQNALREKERRLGRE